MAHIFVTELIQWKHLGKTQLELTFSNFSKLDKDIVITTDFQILGNSPKS